MSSSSRLVRIAAIIAALAIVPALAACSGFRPVYGDASVGGQQQIAVSYASPKNRLEQIIYQDLALRLGTSTGNVPVVSVSVSQSSSTLAGKAAGSTPREMRVTAKLVVTGADGTVLLNKSRSQTADYNSGPQELANQQAAADAAERAAKLLADTIRLEILAALAT
jgi:hypothetical protein